MIKHKDHFHGSDLEKIEEIYGIKKEEIVSFSANVNPLGVSPLLNTRCPIKSTPLPAIRTGSTLLCADASLHTAEPRRRMSLSETAPPS